MRKLVLVLALGASVAPGQTISFSISPAEKSVLVGDETPHRYTVEVTSDAPASVRIIEFKLLFDPEVHQVTDAQGNLLLKLELLPVGDLTVTQFFNKVNHGEGTIQYSVGFKDASGSFTTASPPFTLAAFHVKSVASGRSDLTFDPQFTGATLGDGSDAPIATTPGIFDVIPKAAIEPLQATQPTRTFTVRWGPEDERSRSIQCFDVEMSTDGVSFTPDWQESSGGEVLNHNCMISTFASVYGSPGATYYFRARARDLYGNLQPMPENAQQSTRVATYFVDAQAKPTVPEEILVYLRGVDPGMPTPQVEVSQGGQTTPVTVTASGDQTFFGSFRLSGSGEGEIIVDGGVERKTFQAQKVRAGDPVQIKEGRFRLAGAASDDGLVAVWTTGLAPQVPAELEPLAAVNTNRLLALQQGEVSYEGDETWPSAQLYWHDTDRWQWLQTTWSQGKATAWLPAVAPVLLAEDRQAPHFGVLSEGKQITLAVTEEGSGVDPATLTCTQDGRPLSCRYEEGAKRVEILREGLGQGTIEIGLSDRAGNRRRASFPVSVSQEGESLVIEVFPNPVSGGRLKVRVKQRRRPGELTCRALTARGRPAGSWRLAGEEATITLSPLANGVYLFYCDDGEVRSAPLKVVKLR